MHLVSLLVLVILASALISKAKSPYSRIVIGSIFGIMFFSVWQYTIYYISIYNLSDTYLVVVYGVISLLSVILSILFIRIKYHLTTAIFSFMTFCIVMIFTLSFDSEVKNMISIMTGYYSDAEENRSIQSLSDRRFIHDADFYDITLDDNWQKKEDKGQMFVYFQIFDGEKMLVELRPKCFSGRKFSTPEIVTNVNNLILISEMAPETVCTKNSESLYACRIVAKSKEGFVKRIRWYGLDMASYNGVELDFVLNENHAAMLYEIEAIIQSVDINSQSKIDNVCLGLAEWF